MNRTPLEPWIARKIGVDPARLTRSALETYQLAKLQEVIQALREKSLFYRIRLAGYPAELTSLEDLTTFPFTTADDIRHTPLQFLCVSQSQVQRVVTLDSSGTTGSSKRLFFSQADQELTLDFFHVGMSTFTNPGDQVLILLPVERPGSVGDLLATAVERLGAHGIRHGLVHDVTETLDTLFTEGANALVGVPTQVLALARSPEARRFPAPPIQTALLTMDHVPMSIADSLERAWSCTVYNHYGMTEMGLGGGVECMARRGYHVREADLYIEIVDPRTGLPVAEGETGEIVFTTLTRQAVPLLRYRTGDLSHFIPDPCPCGTCLKTLAHVRSRIQNFVPVGAAFPLSLADLDEILFAVDAILDFSASLENGGDGTHLKLHLYLTETLHERLLTAIRAALDAIPAIRSGQLALTITAEQGYRASGKRTIKHTLGSPTLGR